MSFAFKNKQFKGYSYAQLLQTVEWNSKRFYILCRDSFRCTKCSCRQTEAVKMNGKYFSLGDLKLTTNNGNISLSPEIVFSECAIVLHVHHKIYMLSKLPWEYDEKDYETLCSVCHHKLHEEQDTTVYLDEEKISLENLTECHRCNGEGYFDEFRHVNGGVCFRCGGTKYEEIANHYLIK